MKITAFVIFICSSFISFGQGVKTYSGKYENGKITYQYYENNSYERIYHGTYVYSCERYIDFFGDGYETIKGNFKHNFQDGMWEYSYKSNDNEIKVYIKGGYKDGLMDGIWTKTITNLTKNTIVLKMTASFKDGKLIGDFSFVQFKDVVKGKFNENSHYNGRWSVKYSNDNNEPCEIIYDFNDGLLTFILDRNIATGEIIYKSNEINTEKFYEEYFCDNCGGRHNSIGYVYFITTRLLVNDISNSYSHNYGGFDDGSATFNYGLRKIKYSTLKYEKK